MLTSLAVSTMLGCTAIHVEALPASALRSPHICIERNPAVTLADFLDVIREECHRHGVSTEVYEESLPPSCETRMTYTARRSWDIVTYLSKAELWLWQGDRRVAYAEYHLRGGGGYALTKYQKTATKMRPVMDQLLKEFQGPPVSAVAPESRTW